MGTRVMRLDELLKGQKLHVEVLAKGGMLEYDVTTSLCSHGGVLIEPIRYQGKILNFNRSDITIRVLYARDGEKPIEWDGCFIKTVEYNGEKYHLIGCEKIGVEVNRRGCIRIFLGDKGVAQVGEHRGVLNVTVKDLSCTGFSFIGESIPDAPTGALVHLTFEEGIRLEKFSLYGNVMRKVEMEEKRALYGCKLTKQCKEVDAYIAKRQRDQAQHLQNQLIKRSAMTIYELKKEKE